MLQSPCASYTTSYVVNLPLSRAPRGSTPEIAAHTYTYRYALIKLYQVHLSLTRSRSQARRRTRPARSDPHTCRSASTPRRPLPCHRRHPLHRRRALRHPSRSRPRWRERGTSRPRRALPSPGSGARPGGVLEAKRTSHCRTYVYIYVIPSVPARDDGSDRRIL